MNSFTDLFTGNPFSTPVGQLIEKATDSNQVADNWSLNMSICDHINSSEDGPKDAIRAIRRRFNNAVAAKNTVTAMYTLTVLETCIKNCGYRFHLALANRDFLVDLTKLVGHRTETPNHLQERILSLIQSWVDAFRGQPDLKEIGRIYEELLERGIEFPPTDMDNMVPINTPKPPTDLKLEKSPKKLTGLPKLRHDLQMVQTNVKVFNELLNEFPPNNDISKDAMQLILDLEYTCGQMQTRMVALLGSLESDVANSPGLTNHDTLMAELLKVNDELNNVFIRYERFQRHREGKQTCLPDEKADMMDFKSENHNEAKAASSVAQIYANQSDCKNFSPGLNSHRIKRDEESPFIEGIPDTKEDLDEMEKWVEEHEAAGVQSTALSSSEFDQFLSEKANHKLDINGDSAVNKRQMKQSDKEDSMFAL